MADPYRGVSVCRLALAGLGNVGGVVLDILRQRGAELSARYGTTLRLSGVADVSGAAIDEGGLDPAALLATLRADQPIAGLSRTGRPGMTPTEMLSVCQPDILLEATPVNLKDGQPGLATVTMALDSGVHAVLANKGPLALAYRDLTAKSDLADGWERSRLPHNRPRLRFSACVAGALPVVNLGWRDLAGARIDRVEAVLNGTTHSILRAMETGRSYADALADAQRRGIAEADPTLDVEGLDAACKLVITANSVLAQPTTLADVAVEGITRLTAAELTAAYADEQRVVLLCLAERVGDRYQLSVRPTALPAAHPLARLHPDEMGVVYYTDTVDRLFAATLEPGAAPAAAAMVRDVLDIVRDEQHGPRR
jgi:homoserine dehydrogenase